MEEEREHSIQTWVQVVVRLSLPQLERLIELAPAQDRDEQVPIDAFGRRQTVIRDRAELPQPLEVRRAAPLVRCRARVVEALVVLGEPEAGGEGRGVLVLLFQERIDERGERRRHHRTSPRIGWSSKREPRGIPAQTRLQADARTERPAPEGGAYPSLRGAPASRDAAALGRPSRDARHPRLVGGTTGAATGRRQTTARGPHRGPS